MNNWYGPIQRLLIRRLISRSISISPSHTLNPLSFPPKSMPRRVLTGFLKFGIYSALLTAGVNYAYTVDELFDKTQRLRDFTNACFPVRYTVGPVDVETLDGKPFSIVADLYGKPFKTEPFQSEPGTKDSLPPLEFKSPFIAGVVAVFGELFYLYIKCRRSFQVITEECYAPRPDKLLPDTDRTDLYTLVLDLEETLVHSDWVTDFLGGGHTFKRPGFHAFLDSVHAYGYEVVLYTEVTKINVAPLCASLHTGKSFNHALALGSTIFLGDECYRDLSRLNRDPSRIVYVSARAFENCLQPENCIEIKPWKKKEMDDSTLSDLLPLLEAVLHEKPNDVRPWISVFNWKKDQLAQPRMEEKPMDVEMGME